MSKFEFHAVFEVSRMIIFEVNYYTLRDNKRAYFTTSAFKFNQPKNDWRCGGQGQETILPEFPVAYNFYKKWDAYHLKDMDEKTFDEMYLDFLELCRTYNYLFISEDNSNWKYYRNSGFTFLQEKALSMFPIKKTETNHNKTDEVLV